MRVLRLLLLVAALALPASAFAVESTGTQTAPPPATTTGTTTAPAATTTTSTTPAEEEEEDDDDTGVAFGVLAFALLVIVALLAYLVIVQLNAFKLFGKAIDRGQRLSGGENVGPALQLGGADRAAPAGEPDGPDEVTVGTAADYTVAAPGATQIAWSVAPTGASVAPATGSSTQLTATTAGTYTLTVSVDGTSKEKTVEAVAAGTSGQGQDPGTKVPFPGEGYGSVIIAIVLLAFATVLGLVDILDGSALATLFGAVAGYIFFKAGAATQGGGSETGRTPPTGGSGSSK